MCGFCFSPIKSFVSHEVWHSSRTCSDLSRICCEQGKKLSVGHNKSEGNMLTSHHSQGDIPKINAFMFTRFFELPRKKMCYASVHLVLLITSLVFIWAHTHTNTRSYVACFILSFTLNLRMKVNTGPSHSFQSLHLN